MIKSPLLQRDIEAYFDAYREIGEQRYGLTPETLTAALTLFHREINKANVTTEQYRILANEYAATLRTVKRDTQDQAGPIANGIAVRAALRAGWLEINSVEDLEPWHVSQLANEIVEAVKKAYDVPKN